MMGRKRLWVCFGAMAAMMLMSLVAEATPADEFPVTGITWVDTTFKFLGALYLLVSGIILFLPRTLPLALALARFFGDIKDVRGKAAVEKAIATGSVRPVANRSGEAGFVRVSALFMTSALGIGLIWFLAWFSSGCGATKPACDLVHVADDACAVFNVTLPDGTVERVPSAELVMLAVAHRQARLHGGGP